MPSDRSFNRTDDDLFVTYLVTFFAVWTIYVLLIYPRARRGVAPYDVYCFFLSHSPSIVPFTAFSSSSLIAKVFAVSPALAEPKLCEAKHRIFHG
jgi:hypothetical protein